MATVNTVTGDQKITGNLQVAGSITPRRPRTERQQRELVAFPVPLTSLRVFDAMQTNLPGTAASDDLGISGGTYGTDAPKLVTSDAKATTVTQKGRFTLRVPEDYEDGETIKLRLSAGMNTTVSDGTATVDVSAYVNGRDGTIDGSDLVTTAATTINSLTFADKDFTIDGSGLSAGDELDILITIAITDAATGTAVIGAIGAIELLADIL